MALDLTKPVQTRDGRAVRILCTDSRHPTPVVGLVTARDGTEYLVRWRTDGYVTQTMDSPGDLVNGPTRHELWVNVYPFHRTAHWSRSAADEAATLNRMHCIRVEYVLPPHNPSGSGEGA